MKAPYGFRIIGGGTISPSITITIEKPEKEFITTRSSFKPKGRPRTKKQ